MSRNSTLQIPKRKKPEEIVKILADKHGLTQRQVQRIIVGDSENEDVFAEYQTYTELHNDLIGLVKQNKLLEAVKAAVPFN